MKGNLPIQIKAALLLLIFSLNTIIGFACAVGVDMGFNSQHHTKKREPAKLHVHADGKKHQHGGKAASHHERTNKDNREKDGCCSDAVIKLSQTDKSVPQLSAVVNPVFFTFFIASFYIHDISCSSQVTNTVKYFVSGHHPPFPDIRIAIQSFQI